MSKDTQFVAEYEREFISLLSTTVSNDASGKTIGGIQEGVLAATGLLLETGRRGNKVMFVGNGASATISSHFATDFWKAGGIRSFAFNDPALLTCISNDFSYEQVFQVPVEMFAEKGDTLIAISSSGRSSNILNAADGALGKGCEVLSLSGFAQDNPLRSKGTVNFYVPSPAYGFVEALHTYILHCMLDLVISKRSDQHPR